VHRIQIASIIQRQIKNNAARATHALIKIHAAAPAFSLQNTL
jgi:hypothetical protein